MNEKYIADRLAQLRTQKQVSAREMSLALGQANSYINTIENYKSMPSMRAFLEICDYLEVTPSEFFDEENETPLELKEFVQEVKKLDHQMSKSLLTLMKEQNKRK